MRAEIERAVTANRNALCDLGTGAKILSPLSAWLNPMIRLDFVLKKENYNLYPKLL